MGTVTVTVTVVFCRRGVISAWRSLKGAAAQADATGPDPASARAGRPCAAAAQAVNPALSFHHCSDFFRREGLG